MTEQMIRYDFSGVVSLLPLPWDAPFSIFAMELEGTLTSMRKTLADNGTHMSDADMQDLRDEVWKYRPREAYTRP